MAAVQHEEALWQNYREQLFRFVVRRVEDPDTAEDVVHDVLVRAYRKRDSLRDSRMFEQWLYQITRNAVIDHYRARRPTEALPADLASPGEEGSRAARRELAECLLPLVEALPEHYRDAVILAEVQGLTQQETASRLNLSLSGAKSRVQRARRMLQEKLVDCCKVEFDARGSVVGYESHGGCGPGGASSGGGCSSCRN